MIYRADHTEDFVQIMNSVFWDPRISLKTKGMIGLLLTMREEDFNVNRARLAAIGPDGEATVRAVLKEMADTGYLNHRLVQDERGRWRTEPDLYEDPRQNTDGRKTAIGKRHTDGGKPPRSSKTTRGTDSFRSRRSPKTEKTASISRRRKWQDGLCVVCQVREVDMAHLGAGLCDPCYRASALRSWLREQIGDMRDNQPDVYAALRALWPRGVPTFKESDAHDPGQLELIRDALVAVQPASTNGQGGH